MAVALTSATQRDRKVQRSVDATLYRKRNLVERFFNKLKHFRKIGHQIRENGCEITSLPSSSLHQGSGCGFMSPQPRTSRARGGGSHRFALGEIIGAMGWVEDVNGALSIWRIAFDPRPRRTVAGIFR